MGPGGLLDGEVRDEIECNGVGKGIEGRGLRTAITSVHVCYQGWTTGIEVCNHFSVLTHVMELGNTQIRHAEARSSCSGSSLVYISQCSQCTLRRRQTMYMAEKPTDRAMRAEKPS
jgi:hypothetical protein